MEKEVKIKEYIKEKYNNDKENKIMLFSIVDKIIEYEKYGKEISTCFYNQAQIEIIKENINIEDNNILITGGIEDSERNILIIGENKNIEEYIGVIKIEYKLFNDELKISHRDILGSLLNLGINRNLIGDILIQEEVSYIILKREILTYIIQNLKKIKKSGVRIRKINFNEITNRLKEKNIKVIIVTSMRLDNILSEYLNLSRNKTNELINSKKIFINWKVEENISKLIKENDIISIRGKGRIEILSKNGINRKGKIILEINEYK